MIPHLNPLCLIAIFYIIKFKLLKSQLKECKSMIKYDSLDKEKYKDGKENLKEAIAKNVKELLIRHDITQQQIAQYVGISESSVSRALRAERDFNVYELKCIAEFLNVTLEEIVTGVSLKNKEEHIRTGLSNHSINWLKSIESKKENLLEIINVILGNKEIAEAMFESIYLYSTSHISSTYFKKDGTIVQRQAKNLADDDLLLRYAIMGGFEEILQLIKKMYDRIPNNYHQRDTEAKVLERIKLLGEKYNRVEERLYEVKKEDAEDMLED